MAVLHTEQAHPNRLTSLTAVQKQGIAAAEVRSSYRCVVHTYTTTSMPLPNDTSRHRISRPQGCYNPMFRQSCGTISDMMCGINRVRCFLVAVNGLWLCAWVYVYCINFKDTTRGRSFLGVVLFSTARVEITENTFLGRHMTIISTMLHRQTLLVCCL